MISMRNLDPSLKAMLGTGAILGSSDEHRIGLAAGPLESYWHEDAAIPTDKMHNTITDAYNNMTTARNDYAILSPESHTQGATITWAKNMTHLIGAYPEAFMNQRSRIGHNANFSPMLTVSGYGNLFANLYFMYGRGDAANLNLLNVTGNRNSFHNCHFGSPMNATEGDEATCYTLQVSGQENYFKNCVIGVDTIMRSTTNAPINFASGAARNVFENCLIVMAVDNAGAFFMKTQSGTDRFQYFKNCQFIAFSANMATPITYAISHGATTTSFLYFDSKCSFVGATDIDAAGNEAVVYVGSVPYIAAATGNLIAVNPDVS